MWENLLYLLGGIILGLVSGFLIAKTIMKKQLEKNPPINEDMIKSLMRGMGRNPSQKQVNQLMSQMNRYK